MKQLFVSTLLIGLLLIGCSNQGIQASSQPKDPNDPNNVKQFLDKRQTTVESPRQQEIHLFHDYVRSQDPNGDPNKDSRRYYYYCASGVDNVGLLFRTGTIWSTYSHDWKVIIVGEGASTWSCRTPEKSKDIINSVSSDEMVQHVDDLYKAYPEDKVYRFADIMRAFFSLRADGAKYSGMHIHPSQ